MQDYELFLEHCKETGMALSSQIYLWFVYFCFKRFQQFVPYVMSSSVQRDFLNGAIKDLVLGTGITYFSNEPESGPLHLFINVTEVTHRLRQYSATKWLMMKLKF